jgi:hypothetical protein
MMVVETGGKGSRMNNFMDFAPGLGSDSIDVTEENRRNSPSYFEDLRWKIVRRRPEDGMRKREVILSRALSSLRLLRRPEIISTVPQIRFSSTWRLCAAAHNRDIEGDALKGSVEIFAYFSGPFRGIVEQGNYEFDEFERPLIDNESFEVECEFESLFLCVHAHLPFFEGLFPRWERGIGLEKWSSAQSKLTGDLRSSSSMRRP